MIRTASFMVLSVSAAMSCAFEDVESHESLASPRQSTPGPGFLPTSPQSPIRHHAHVGSVSAMDDIDGDGIADYLVGHQGGGVSPNVTCVSGRTNQPIYALPQTQLFGGVTYVKLLENVHQVGDMDGDGVRDFGAQVVYGGNQGLMIHSGADGSVLRVYPGTSIYFANEFRGIGDVDGDGLSDVLIFVGYGSGSSFVGSVEVFSASGASIRLHVGAYYGYGWSFSTAGDDFNADGVEDYLVATGDHGIPAGNEGHTNVYSGATGHMFAVLDHQGDAMHVIGDIDGDGRRELAIGQKGTVHPSPSNVVPYSLATQSPIYELLGKPTTLPPYWGEYLARSDDVDHDGIDDLLVGHQSQLYGNVVVHSGASGHTVGKYFGQVATPYHFHGFGKLADAVDRTGDGVPDPLIASSSDAFLFDGSAQLLTNDVYEISIATGGKVTTRIDAGAQHFGAKYVLMFGASGWWPGFQERNALVPLNKDSITQYFLDNPNSAIAPANSGYLDHQGRATSPLTIPANFMGLAAGTVLTMTCLVVDAHGRVTASLPTGVELID